MEHNEAEHGDTPFHVHTHNYSKNEFPSIELLSSELQRVASNIRYQGNSRSQYIADAFNSAFEYGLSPEYLLSHASVYTDISPDYYPEFIDALVKNETNHHFYRSVENDLILKRFALQLDIHSGEWAEAYQYATETLYDESQNGYVTSNEDDIGYYLVSVLMLVLKFIEKRDHIELINKNMEFDYHLGYNHYTHYSPKQFGLIMRGLSLSNESRLEVINPDHKGRVHFRNAIPILDLAGRINTISQLLNGVHDYKVYENHLDPHVADTIVMLNNLLTIWNPHGHVLQPESGEVARMADFINNYGYEKTILAVHNHGYSLEALDTFDGMPRKWVKELVQEYPYNFTLMKQIIQNS
jgi:hypothetical protein